MDNSLNIKGIDISKWQNGIDFNLVKNDGVEIIYIKATQGINEVEPTLDQFYNSASNLGFSIGFYHFLDATQSGREQAQFMYSQIKNLKYQCRITIDIEISNGVKAPQVNQCVLDFAKEIETLTGMQPIVYSFSPFANTILNNTVGHLKYWQAQYNVETPTPLEPFWSNWVGWQYTNKGNFGGIQTDLDLFNDGIYI